MVLNPKQLNHVRGKTVEKILLLLFLLFGEVGNSVKKLTTWQLRENILQFQLLDGCHMNLDFGKGQLYQLPCLDPKIVPPILYVLPFFLEEDICRYSIYK